MCSHPQGQPASFLPVLTFRPHRQNIFILSQFLHIIQGTHKSSLVHVYSYMFIHTLQDTAREAIPFCAPAVYSLFRSQIFSRVWADTFCPYIGVNTGIHHLQQPSTKSIRETSLSCRFLADTSSLNINASDSTGNKMKNLELWLWNYPLKYYDQTRICL